MEKKKISAKIIADSINMRDVRLTSLIHNNSEDSIGRVQYS